MNEKKNASKRRLVKRLAIGALMAGMAFAAPVAGVISQGGLVANAAVEAGTKGSQARPVHMELNKFYNNNYALTGKTLNDYYYFHTTNSDDNEYVIELTNRSTDSGVDLYVYEESNKWNTGGIGWSRETLGRVYLSSSDNLDTVSVNLENDKNYYLWVQASEKLNYKLRVIHSESSVVKKLNGTWTYYNKNGKTDYTYSGLAKADWGGWVYIRKGVFYRNWTGLAKAESGKWYYVKDGHYNTSFTGLAKSPTGRWYHVTKGKYNPSYTGLSRSATGRWYYVKNGKYDTSYTGLAKAPSGKWYYVKNGKYDTSYSGRVRYNGKYYTVRNGKVV